MLQSLRINVGVINRTAVEIVFSTLLILTGLLLVVFVQLPGSTMFWQEVQNTGHSIVFLILTVALLRIFILRAGPDVRVFCYPASVVLLLVLGASTELMQLLTGRDAELDDFARDVAGVVAGLGLAAFFDSNLRMYSRHALSARIFAAIIFTAAIGLGGYRLVALWVSYVQRDNAFPQVINLRSGWSAAFVRSNQASITDAVGDTGESAGLSNKSELAHITLQSGEYPGISMLEPYPDWSAYRQLTMPLYSYGSSAFELTVRIHDKQHNDEYNDRYNETLRVQPGANVFSLPLQAIAQAPIARALDLRQIAEIKLFAVNANAPIAFDLGVVRLE